MSEQKNKKGKVKVEWLAHFIQIAILIVLVSQINAATDAQIVNNLITLNQQMYPCLKTKDIFKNIQDKKKIFTKNGGPFSELEMDNFLGYFEMIGIIHSKKYLDTQTIDIMFGNDILSLSKNQEIQEYINDTTDNPDPWPSIRHLIKVINKERDNDQKNWYRKFFPTKESAIKTAPKQ